MLCKNPTLGALTGIAVPRKGQEPVGQHWQPAVAGDPAAALAALCVLGPAHTPTAASTGVTPEPAGALGHQQERGKQTCQNSPLITSC